MNGQTLKRVFCLASLALGYALAAVGAQGQQPKPSPTSRAEKTLPRLSRGVTLGSDNENVTPSFFPDNAAGPRWIFRYKQPTEVGFLRLRIRLRRRADNAASWHLVLKDAQQREIERLTPESFHGQPPDAQAWTDIVEGREVFVELWSDLNPLNLKLEVDRVNYEFASPGPRAITTGVNSMQPLLDFTPQRDHPYYGLSLPIAFVRFVKASDGTDSNCTGFLLTPDLFITNQHCISEEWQLGSARVEFNYEPSPPRRESFKIGEIVMQDPSLDFTLLKLKRPATNWPTVKIGGNPKQAGQSLVLIGHPSGSYKTISLVECTVEHLRPLDRPDRPDDFYHLCDTEGGESGSPVIDQTTGRVVGLHYYGITGSADNGRNLAVNINAVLEKIRKKSEDLHKLIVQHTQ